MGNPKKTWKDFKKMLAELEKELESFNKTSKYFDMDISEADVGFNFKPKSEEYVGEKNL